MFRAKYPHKALTIKEGFRIKILNSYIILILFINSFWIYGSVIFKPRLSGFCTRG